jgi:hypothetical protein
MSGTDKRDLREALRIIREAVPTATTADFATSDQDSYGFTLVDVTLADGTKLSDNDLNDYDILTDAVEIYINDLSWNGVMGENRHGDVTITIPPASEFDEQVTAENAYMADLLTLIDSFNYERCSVCHNDLNRHSISPDPLGKPHLYCLDLDA